jgi:predicted ATP-dependent endonuclease of OLD family
MVEEPENGVHPHALEIILKALAAIPSAQVFVATHSPLVVQQVGVKPLLCFTRDEKDGIHIVHGENHPALRNWDGTPDLASIFASRVLG